MNYKLLELFYNFNYNKAKPFILDKSNYSNDGKTNNLFYKRKKNIIIKYYIQKNTTSCTKI